MARYLPVPGFPRIAFFVLACLLLALKVLAVLHFRADSDEAQHAHVVWGWSTGRLQYRDLFDNHMPLFQMAMAPYFRLWGERPDILIPLRFAMLPLYLLSLWCVFRLAERLFPPGAAPWIALAAGAVPRFFFTSTEFRTDDLWAAVWLLTLVVAVGGRFTLRRAFAVGLLLGLALAVSMKTVILLIALAAASSIAIALGASRARIPWPRIPLFVIVTLAGAAIIPGLTILYFWSKGALWIMYYCVVAHNIVPGPRGIGRLAMHRWAFPASLPFLIAYGWLIFRQAKDPGVGMHRILILLIPCIYFILLVSYWPNVSREDDLPYVPLLPFVLIPFLILASKVLPGLRAERYFWSPVLPTLCLLELILTWNTHNIQEDRLRVLTDNIAVVLKITKSDDYVMDTKSGYIFRPRPYYWVLEPMTKARIRSGAIRDNLIQRLEQRAVKVCYFFSAYAGTPEAAFIVANYLPVDLRAIGVGAAGKSIGNAPSGGTFDFDVAIPVRYDIVSDSGSTSGDLDGHPYTGPVALAAGRHEFHRTSGTGRVAIILADAVDAGFHPLLDASAKLAETLDKTKSRETD